VEDGAETSNEKSALLMGVSVRQVLQVVTAIDPTSASNAVYSALPTPNSPPVYSPTPHFT
jgi:hypothetical protein